jgi:hypothetical protein
MDEQALSEALAELTAAACEAGKAAAQAEAAYGPAPSVDVTPTERASSPALPSPPLAAARGG